jgi:flagellar FliL protein
MADSEEDESVEEKKPSKLPLILGLVVALLGGGGGFYATWSGMLMGDETVEDIEVADTSVQAIPDIVFVPVDPLVVPLPNGAEATNLLFRAQLEVPVQYQEDVQLLLPRVIDVLNGYLRALNVTDIENPSALSRLRAQMLRRVQIVTGEGRVNDLLIMEFVLN